MGNETRREGMGRRLKARGKGERESEKQGDGVDELRCTQKKEMNDLKGGGGGKKEWSINMGKSSIGGKKRGKERGNNNGRQKEGGKEREGKGERNTSSKN